jgi:uncharacterized RDD family membrane protein YckC
MHEFSARETAWLQELDGIELAGFWPRALAFLIDWTIIAIIFSVLASLMAIGYLGFLRHEGKPIPSVSELTNAQSYNIKDGEAEFSSGAKIKTVRLEENELTHLITGVLVPILYFGILLWAGKGRTPGKRMMRIRVVSIVHPHISFWHSVERALGYGAAALEMGFGFVQFFIHPYRRCAQDRLAETIVVTERSYRAMEHKFAQPLVHESAD